MNDLMVCLQMMTDDCQHLLNILERKAEQEWDYKYQQTRIDQARASVAMRQELIDMIRSRSFERGSFVLISHTQK